MFNKYTEYWFIKDGFKQGEYSVYEGIPKQTEKYLFGVSKLFEAKQVCKQLNSKHKQFIHILSDLVEDCEE